MKRRHLLWILVCLVCAGSGSSSAQTEICDALGEAERETALAILSSQRPYDHCDATILQCLAQTPVSPLAKRLADAVCRRAEAGQDQAAIADALAKRAESVANSTVEIDLSRSVAAGDPNAPVEIVAYVCTRCPYCAVHTLHLHESVTSGSLKGKAKLYIRPYVLRNHTGSSAGGLALLAAQKLGKFWEMLIHMFENFDDYDSAKLPEWAALQGMDADQFRELQEDATVRSALVESQKEGIRNGVSGTPTIFVNRRKYAADLSPIAFIDFVEGEFERLRETQ
jgi:protein-disulfide isomerase